MNKQAIKHKIFTNPIYFIAFGFGTGLSAIAPGTLGTLVAIPIYSLLHFLPLAFYLIILMVLTFFGFWICGLTTQEIGVHDYPGVNFDEIIGFLWTMVAIPFKWYWIMLGFLLFRLFDIWKPWPIRWLDQKVKGGFGVVVDDIVAGIFAWVTLQIIMYAIKITSATGF